MTINDTRTTESPPLRHQGRAEGSDSQNGNHQSSGQETTNASMVSRPADVVPPRELVVWECQCGRIHHTGALSALADACRPERVEVRQ